MIRTTFGHLAVVAALLGGLAGCRAASGGAARVLDARSFAFDVAFLPDGQLGCALLEHGEHRLVSFDRRSGRRLWQLRLGDGQDQLTGLAVSPSGSLLAAGFRELRSEAGADGRAIRSSSTQSLSAGGSVLLVEPRHGRLLRRLPVPRPVLALAFLDEQKLALGTAAAYRRDHSGLPQPVPSSAGVCLLRTSGQWVGCRTDHSDSVTAVARLEGGVASGSWDGTVRLWGPRLEPLVTMQVGAPVNALAFAPRASEGPLLAVATSREPPRRSRALTDLEARGGHRRAVHLADRVELWSLTSRQRSRIFQPHRFYVTELAVSPDASVLASGSWDFSVAVQRSGRQPLRFDRFSQIITGLALSPEADALAVAAWTEQGSGTPSCVLLPVSIANSASRH